MMDNYLQDKDIYATIATGIYNNKYEDNTEKYADGSPNVEGAKRRKTAKNVLLGMLYGRGPASIAEQLDISIKEASDIINRFYSAFPSLKEWKLDTEEKAKKFGYVEDIWGRRRRLPDINLPRFTIKETSNDKTTNNPLLYCKPIITKSKNYVYYENLLKNSKSREEINKIKEQALKDKIQITDNNGFIARAERQCVNAVVQGSASTQTKKAMISIYNNEELKNLGFKLLVAVHDELIGECPIENQQEVSNILTDIMKHSAEPEVNIPFKCDATITKSWYEDEMSAQLKKEISSYVKEGFSREQSMHKCLSEHEELIENQLNYLIQTY